jgi:hypothetical protein
MASTARSYPPRTQGLTRFLKPESPCYDDTGLNSVVLFPFSYSNGTLDISYSGNTFEADMVTTTGVAPDSESDVAVQIFSSGPQLVTSLGNNFKAYIRAWRTGTIDPDSPINIYINPQVIRVQEVQRANIDAINNNSYKISTVPPASDTYPTGLVANNYQTKYVFKTPLTFTILESGVTTYITFKTAFDQE